MQAASFNYELIYNISNAIGVEVRAKNNNATAHEDYNFHTGLSCWYDTLCMWCCDCCLTVLTRNSSMTEILVGVPLLILCVTLGGAEIRYKKQ